MEAGRNETIAVLVVDDHEIVRHGLRAFLDGEPDLEVVGEAEGGAEALDLLASMESDGHRPDVIVMDLTTWQPPSGLRIEASCKSTLPSREG
jgi:DNA-binding NarL/FixJ family response regulator